MAPYASFPVNSTWVPKHVLGRWHPVAALDSRTLGDLHVGNLALTQDLEIMTAATGGAGLRKRKRMDFLRQKGLCSSNGHRAQIDAEVSGGNAAQASIAVAGSALKLGIDLVGEGSPFIAVRRTNGDFSNRKETMLSYLRCLSSDRLLILAQVTMTHTPVPACAIMSSATSSSTTGAFKLLRLWAGAVCGSQGLRPLPTGPDG